MLSKISELEQVVQSKNAKLLEMEEKLNELEQYSRKDNLIISGFKLQRSYASVTKTEEDEEENNQDSEASGNYSVEDQIIKFLGNHELELKSEEISACHTLKSKNSNQTKDIIIRLVNRKTKVRLLKDSKKLHGTKVFINEHLTTKNGEIAKQARSLRKSKKIIGTWVRNGAVFIKFQANNSEDVKVRKIKNKEELDQFY